MTRKFTVPIQLPADPANPLEAATKQYVDTKGNEVVIDPNDPIATAPNTELWFDSDATPVGGLAETSFIGEIKMYGGDNAPANWMLCQGQALLRSTYDTLFQVIGTKFGAGNGSTTFNIPTLQGRTPMGYWPGGTWAATLGAMGGNENLSVPDHFHGVNINSGNPSVNHTHTWGAQSGYVSADHAHYTSGTTSTESDWHEHGFPEGWFYHSTGNPAYYLHVTGGGGYDAASDTFNFGGWATVSQNRLHSHTLGAWSGGINTNHSHYTSGTSDGVNQWWTHNVTGNTANAGVSAALANLPPYAVVNFMIRTN